jgi:hypothetical protein
VIQKGEIFKLLFRSLKAPFWIIKNSPISGISHWVMGHGWNPPLVFIVHLCLCSIQCLVHRYGVLIFAGWGKRLEASHHHQTDFARHSRSAQRTQHQGSGTSRSLHYLLVSDSFRPWSLFELCMQKTQVRKFEKAGSRNNMKMINSRTGYFVGPTWPPKVNE